MASSQFFSESKAGITTTKLASTLLDLKSIQVIVQSGRGMGSQRCAITLMLRLRELGFHGVFEVVFSNYFNDISTNLTLLFSNFKPIKIEAMKQADIEKPKKLVSLEMPSLGHVNVTQIRGLEMHELPPAKLTIIPGLFHSYEASETLVSTLNSDTVITVQPTDWEGGTSFIYFRDATPASRLIKMDPLRTMRLSTDTAFLPPLPESLTFVENNILKCCESKAVNTQLVYGLYKSRDRDTSGFFEEYKATITPDRQCINLINAHRILQKKTNNNVMLFFPQEIVNKEFCESIRRELDHYSIMWFDLTKQPIDDTLSAMLSMRNIIIMAYTGNLSLTFFDFLLLNKTNFPPVIEGCNTRETCEYRGRPFLHGGWDETKGVQSLKKYSFPDEESSEYQKIHANASLCLQETSCSDSELMGLSRYLEDTLHKEPRLLDYHKARQREYLKRPDVCEAALQVWKNRKVTNIVEENNQHLSISPPAKR